MSGLLTGIGIVALLAFWAGLAIGGTWREPPRVPGGKLAMCPHGDGWDDCPDCRH